MFSFSPVTNGKLKEIIDDFDDDPVNKKKPLWNGSCCDILFIYGEDMVLSKYRRVMIQWNLSVTTTSMIKFITCDLFSNVF